MKPLSDIPFSDGSQQDSWRTAELHTAEIIRMIQPTRQSEETRSAISMYVGQLVKSCVDCKVLMFGSVPLKTYLPHGDIDLTVLPEGEGWDESWPYKVQGILQMEERNRFAPFPVSNVQFIQAEVKIVKCLVGGIVIDISFNQVGGLCTICFLEEVDCLIGRDHLFKRSILLVKAWCYYESRILGAHHGLISTYGLETLILYVFHLFHKDLHGPLQVLYKFMDYFANFDWDRYCVSLSGPVPKESLPQIIPERPAVNPEDLLLSDSFLQSCKEKYGEHGREKVKNKPFILKSINIIDYRLESNNLGRSVSKGNFQRIKSALKLGAARLAAIVNGPTSQINSLLDKFFKTTWQMAGQLAGARPDCQPRQMRHSHPPHIPFAWPITGAASWQAVSPGSPGGQESTIRALLQLQQLRSAILVHVVDLINKGWRPDVAYLLVMEAMQQGKSPIQWAQTRWSMAIQDNEAAINAYYAAATAMAAETSQGPGEHLTADFTPSDRVTSAQGLPAGDSADQQKTDPSFSPTGSDPSPMEVNGSGHIQEASFGQPTIRTGVHPPLDAVNYFWSPSHSPHQAPYMGQVLPVGVMPSAAVPNHFNPPTLAAVQPIFGYYLPAALPGSEAAVAASDDATTPSNLGTSEDILAGDMKVHLENLKYGRGCEYSQPGKLQKEVQGSILLAPTLSVGSQDSVKAAYGGKHIVRKMGRSTSLNSHGRSRSQDDTVQGATLGDPCSAPAVNQANSLAVCRRKGDGMLQRKTPPLLQIPNNTSSSPALSPKSDSDSDLDPAPVSMPESLNLPSRDVLFPSLHETEALLAAETNTAMTNESDTELTPVSDSEPFPPSPLPNSSPARPPMEKKAAAVVEKVGSAGSGAVSPAPGKTFEMMSVGFGLTIRMPETNRGGNVSTEGACSFGLNGSFWGSNSHGSSSRSMGYQNSMSGKQQTISTLGKEEMGSVSSESSSFSSQLTVESKAGNGCRAERSNGYPASLSGSSQLQSRLEGSGSESRKLGWKSNGCTGGATKKLAVEEDCKANGGHLLGYVLSEEDFPPLS